MIPSEGAVKSNSGFSSLSCLFVDAVNNADNSDADGGGVGRALRAQLTGWTIIECGMQALDIADVLDEAGKIRFGIGETGVLLQVDLFAFDRFAAGLGLGIVVWVALRRHTDMQCC